MIHHWIVTERAGYPQKVTALFELVDFTQGALGKSALLKLLFLIIQINSLEQSVFLDLLMRLHKSNGVAKSIYMYTVSQ